MVSLVGIGVVRIGGFNKCGTVFLTLTVVHIRVLILGFPAGLFGWRFGVSDLLLERFVRAGHYPGYRSRAWVQHFRGGFCCAEFRSGCYPAGLGARSNHCGLSRV